MFIIYSPGIFNIDSSVLLYPTVLKRNASLGGGPGGGPGGIKPGGMDKGGPGGIMGGGNLEIHIATIFVITRLKKYIRFQEDLGGARLKLMY